MTTLQVNYASTFTAKCIGLIGVNSDTLLFFRTRFGIHTFFLKQPIDVIILDQTLRIRKLMHNLKPNRILFWNPMYYNVIEGPSKTIHNFHLSLGDKITLSIPDFK